MAAARAAGAPGPFHKCPQGRLPWSRETKYLPGSHLSLGALLVSRQQRKEKKKKTLSVQVKNEGSEGNVNGISESVLHIYPRGRWEFSPAAFK